MKLKEIVGNIVDIAKVHPNINSTWVGDVYELNHYNDVDYCAFVLTQQQHNINNEEDYITYNFNLFYVDRLTSDESNRLDVQSAGVSFLMSMVDKIEELQVIVDDYTISTFNEKFNDVCAGAYLNIAIRVNGIDCDGEGIEIITPDKLKEITISENGTYEGLFKKVIVDVEGGKEPVLQPLRVTEDGVYTPEEGTDGFDVVNVKHQFEPRLIPDNLREFYQSDKGWNGVYLGEKLFSDSPVEITENGTTQGYFQDADGKWKVAKNINVDVQPKLTTFTYNRGDSQKEFIFDPEDYEGYDGWNKIELNMPLGAANFTKNGTYLWEDSDVDAHRLYWGYGDITVDVQPDLRTLTCKRGSTLKEYIFDPEEDEGDGWNKVILDMPMLTANITQNGTIEWKDVDKDAQGIFYGWDKINVNIPEPVLNPIEIFQNGEYVPIEGADGFNKVVVNVPEPQLIAISKEYNENGNYTIDVPEGYDGISGVEVAVNVPEPQLIAISKEYNENGNYTIDVPQGYDGISGVEVEVNVPQQSAGFDTTTLHSAHFAFSGYTGTSLDLSHFYTTNITDMIGMFYKCSGLTSLDVSHFDTSNVTSMQQMFSGCNGITSLDVSHFDTSNVTNMSNMFSSCSALTSLDLSNFDTSNVTSMSGMFSGCKVLNTLNISSFKTNNVTNMSNMFSSCSALTSLDLSNFDTSNVTDMSYMCSGDGYLVSVNMSGFTTTKVKTVASMFQTCSRLTDLDISGWDLTLASGSTAFSNFINGCKVLQNVTADNLILPKNRSLTFVSQATALTADSIVAFLNGLQPITAGYTFTIGATNLAKLTDAQKAIATSKGWKLA